MGGIDVPRWLGGGVAAGALFWVLEGLGSMFYMDRMEEVLTAHGLAMEMSAATMAGTLAASFLAGFVIVFFYAAARPRFGPGPRTAVIVAVALWVGGYLLSLLGYAMFGLFPTGLLVTWGALGLVEMILVALLGGWIYREDAAAP